MQSWLMPSRHLYILRLQGPDKQNCLPSSMTPKGKNGSGKSHTNIPALVRDPVPASKGPAMIDMVDIPDILKAFKVSTQAEAKDVVASLVLSEAVYKIMDLDRQSALQAVRNAAHEFPSELQQDLHLQWSLPHVHHRYLVAEGTSSLYVAFMGTKSSRDFLTNAAVVQELLWEEHRYNARGEPAAHKGFVRRARSIPINGLLQLAASKGKKLILCGHSLGASVAEICALDLLHEASKRSVHPPDLKVIGFAAPAIGNAALAEYVRQQSWQKYLSNYILPEDKIANFLGFPALEQGEEDLPGSVPDDCASRSPSQPEMALASNIVSFRPLSRSQKAASDQQLQRQHMEREQMKQAFSVWSAKRAYHAVTFPLWASKSFSSISQRFYLNNTGVGRQPQAPQPDSLAASSRSRFQLSAEPVQEGGQLPTAEAKVSNKQQASILLMHRLPVYRTRMLQFSKAGVTPQVRLRAASVVRSGESLVPQPLMEKATILQPSLTACLRLEESMHSSQICQLFSSVWQGLHRHGLSSLQNCSAGTLLAWLWSVLFMDTLFKIIMPPTLSIYVSAKGQGLQHASIFNLQLPSGTRIKGQRVGERVKKEGGWVGCQDALARLLSWYGNAKCKGNAVLLRFRLTTTQALQVQDAISRPHLEYKTDFYTSKLLVKVPRRLLGPDYQSMSESRGHSEDLSQSALALPECACQH